MKILIILSHLDQTGMTTNTIDLCEGLSLLGHKVTLLVGKNKNKKINQIHANRLSNINVNTKYFRYDDSLYSRICAVLQISFNCLRNFDIIHVESPYLTFIPYYLRKKFTSTFHVNDLTPCFYYKNATHLIAISKETKDFAIKHFNFKSENISIVNHGVSLGFATKISSHRALKIKNQHNIPTNKFIIGFVGSIEKRKGHDILLNAISNLPINIRNQIHIVFIGSSKDGKTNEWFSNLINQTNTNNIITRIEYCNCCELYKIFDVFIFPSRLEGFGLVVIEAMLSGCCVIRSNTEGAYEQINHGIDGFIFENEKVTQLSGIIEMLIQSPYKIKEIAQKGQEKALRLFTCERMAKEIVEVYNKIINEY